VTTVYCPACKETTRALDGDFFGSKTEFGNYYCSNKEECKKIKGDIIKDFKSLLEDKNKSMRWLTPERIDKLSDKDLTVVARFFSWLHRKEEKK